MRTIPQARPSRRDALDRRARPRIVAGARVLARTSVARAGAVAAMCALLPALGCGELDPEFGGLVPEEPAATPDEEVLFGRDIRPLMERGGGSDTVPHGCKKCHYESEPEHVGYDLSGLDLSTLGALRKGGGTSGERIVVAGDPASSALVQKLEGTYGFGARMPRNGPPFWTQDEIGLVRSWIAAGAPGEDDE